MITKLRNPVNPMNSPMIYENNPKQAGIAAVNAQKTFVKKISLSPGMKD